MICSSFDELINSGYDRYNDVVGIYEKIDGKYVGKTFGEFYTDVRSLAKTLLGMGLYGKRVMLCGKNSYHWMVSFLAVSAYVGIAVPIDKEWTRNDINNVLSDLNIDLIFYSGYTEETLADINSPKANFENDMVDFIIQGRELDIVLGAQSPKRICAMFFTSGTMSAPKKIELTERNFFVNADSMAELVSISTNDRYMVSLPFNHIATIIANFVYPIYMGARLYIPNDFKEMSTDLKLIRPTVLYGVPRVFEKLWETVCADKKVAGVIKFSNFLRKFGVDIRENLFSKLHESLGGAIRFAYNGAAKLDDAIIQAFNEMGLLILQAYGMTESSAIIACDSAMNYRLGSVGKVLSNQVCKIINQDENDIGEIYVKGENVAECAIAADGYLHTGDLGYIDGGGYLFIVGRNKRLIKLSNAKNVYPDELEELLTRNKEILRARVYEKDGCISAKIVSGCEYETVHNIVEMLNKTLPHYMQIRQITVNSL